MKSFIFALVFALTFQSAFAQKDSIKNEKTPAKPFFRHEIVPLSLITVGSLLNIGDLKYHVEDALPQTHTTAENYLIFAPMAGMYAFDALGIKHQNTVFNQTKYLFITQLTTLATVQILKTLTKVPRPTGARNSFPSGHTALAFAGATVLFHEFKDTERWIAYSGFAVATTVGVLRMTNRRHWLPDVVTGAGIGILTADLVYYVQPLKKLELKTKNHPVSFFPAVGYQSFALACNF